MFLKAILLYLLMIDMIRVFYLALVDPTVTETLHPSLIPYDLIRPSPTIHVSAAYGLQLRLSYQSISYNI